MDIITFECSECRQVLRVGADKAGRQAKCPRCETILQIPSSAASKGKPKPAPTTPQPQRGRSRREDDEEDERISSKRPARRPRDEDEDYEEERPRSRRRPDRDEEDEYEEDDRPRRRRPAREDDYEEEEDRPSRRKGRRDEEDEEEYDRPARGKRGSMDKVRLGLLLVFIAACVLGAACLPQAVYYISYTLLLINATLPGKFFEWMIKISEMFVLAYGITAIVGYILCLLGPNRRGSLPLIITTLAVGAISTIMSFIFHLLPAFGVAIGGAGGGMGVGPGPGAGGGGSAFLGWFLLLICQLLFAAELILFPLFLRAVALGVKNHSLAQDCFKVVVFGAAYAGERLFTWIMLYVFTKSPSKGMMWVCIILMWIGFLIFLAQLVFYILLLLRARSELD